MGKVDCQCIQDFQGSQAIQINVVMITFSCLYLSYSPAISGRFPPLKQKDAVKHEPSGPGINPETLTSQKREWIDSQVAQIQQTLSTWPEHLFEHFFVVVRNLPLPVPL